MLQLTYISTATPGMNQAMVDEILETSRRNNHADAVTGLLLYDGYRFLQALEGEEAAVRRVYERVKADPRHRAVVQLSAAVVDARAFGDWSMAAQRVAVGQGTTVGELVDRLTADIPDANMRALFRGFARVRNAA